MKALFFGDIVVVDEDQIGVIVKSWGASLTGTKRPPHHEVYVRLYNGIKEYNENEIERYGVRHKYLSDEEKDWQSNSINGY